MTTGETNLPLLLRQMDPELHSGVYVFSTHRDPGAPLIASSIAAFRENEGTTLVLPLAEAERLGLPYGYEAAWITLRVHSALTAVGLTAAVATALAEAGISCNVMVGYYHDHLFVDHALAVLAMDVLRRLSQEVKP